MNFKYAVTSMVVMSAWALLWWCLAFCVYLLGGDVDANISAISFIITVSFALGYFRIFKIRTGIWMAIGWWICWFLLPEFSMSMSDRLAALWNPNRVGFGGVTLMAMTAVLVGLISNSIGSNKLDEHDNK